MKTTFDAALREINKQALTSQDKGGNFERLVLWYLRNDPLYRSQFTQVWLWRDWPGAPGINADKHESGIDIVAKNANDNGYAAIQCKNWSTNNIGKSDIEKFVVASGRSEVFTARYLVTAARQASQHTLAAFKEQDVPIKCIHRADFSLSEVDWGEYFARPTQAGGGARGLRDYQEDCITSVIEAFKQYDRGQVIMACGTGKTFTALKLSERLLHEGGTVLYLLPSLSLIKQVLREWMNLGNHTLFDIQPLIVCSDSSASRPEDSDEPEMSLDEAGIDVTTSGMKLTEFFRHLQNKTQAQTTADTNPDLAGASGLPPEPITPSGARLTVVFSTYHSLLRCVKDAQINHGFPEFDLVICDEAHRTAGVESAKNRQIRVEADDDESISPFHAVHSDVHIKTKRRLYMTATPKIGGTTVQQTAKEQDVELYDMSDEERFGPVFFRFGFAAAIAGGWLSDYHVVVLRVDEKYVTHQIMQQIETVNKQLIAEQETMRPDAAVTTGSREVPRGLTTEDAAKLIGIYKAFRNQGEEFGIRHKRALMFNSSIYISKFITRVFPMLVKTYKTQFAALERNELPYDMDIEHVDGSMSVLARAHALSWLKENDDPSQGRIISNVRCLSEGIDVPALDSVVFMHPRRSIVDIVQAVGRVMRIAPGKEKGYVVLPIVVPEGAEAEKHFENESQFKLVRQVIDAMRAHDDRLEAKIDLSALNTSPPKIVDVFSVDEDGEVASSLGDHDQPIDTGESVLEHKQAPLPYQDWLLMINAHLLKRNRRDFWPKWSEKVERIVGTVSARVEGLLAAGNVDKEVSTAFGDLLQSLRMVLHPGVSPDDVIETLAQDIVTGPMFSAIMGGDHFRQHNVVANSLQQFQTLLRARMIDTDLRGLDRFIDEVKLYADHLHDDAARREAINQMYGSFFKQAFPLVAERLGIVYTPEEVVRFLLASAEHVLVEKFGNSLNNPGVHILDPFAGTGTFMQKLISDQLSTNAVIHKINTELHSNEILLFPYYMGTTLIELAYMARTQSQYTPFKGSLWTDSFQIHEDKANKQQIFPPMLDAMQERRLAQAAQPVKVIVGNPPYSSGQGSANDRNQNEKYPLLDERIQETYATLSTAKLKNSLYDSYVRAIRLATDAIVGDGVIAFVTNGGYIDGKAFDGFRSYLEKEFSDIYCLNLRGDARTSGEQRRKEKDNIFGSGTRATIALLVLVKRAEMGGHLPGKIHYHDIGDYLTKDAKLQKLVEFGSIAGVPWQQVQPDVNNDWIDKREQDYAEKLVLMGDEDNKKNFLSQQKKPAMFWWYGSGLKTGRDAYVYDFASDSLRQRVERMVEFFNAEVTKYRADPRTAKGHKLPAEIVDHDPKKFSWDVATYNLAIRSKQVDIDSESIRTCMYRPFVKKQVVFITAFNQRQNQNRKFFRTPTTENRLIGVHGNGSNKPFSCMLVNKLPDLEIVSKSQFFAEHWYDDDNERHENISDATRDFLRDKLAMPALMKPDIFDYVYGVLHAKDFRDKYRINLQKDRPRIPLIGDASTFEQFRAAGAELGCLHTGYEEVAPHSAVRIDANLAIGDVVKIRFGGRHGNPDRTKILIAPGLRIENIPPEAYAYEVNGKSAVVWVMEGYSRQLDKRSGIIHDPNSVDGGAQGIAELLTRVIHVATQSQAIIDDLPNALDSTLLMLE